MKTQTIKRDGLSFTVRNVEEFERIYADIFERRDYDFESDIDAPFIIDAGAHVGVATLYFKSRYPRSRVVAFEPNPETFRLLQKNIAQNQVQEVQLVNATLAPEAGTVPFYISRETENPWTWGDAAVKNAWYSDETTRTIQVPGVRLSDYLTGTVDLLKLDIEGLEVPVLQECAAKLDYVKRMIIEFHFNSRNNGTALGDMVDGLQAAGFTVTLQQYDGQEASLENLPDEEAFVLMVHARRG